MYWNSELEEEKCQLACQSHPLFLILIPHLFRITLPLWKVDLDVQISFFILPRLTFSFSALKKSCDFLHSWSAFYFYKMLMFFLRRQCAELYLDSSSWNGYLFLEITILLQYRSVLTGYCAEHMKCIHIMCVL